ncbi:MAG: restriction endonuclease [Nitrososphaerota archaeon]|jgi:HJR/Mrr/RecB family endonuclease|uniref:restriction endonuclease n=1 Tax=Candidatus Bathycorpusculum sp. TaxID=2994959 RepID=UPI0028350B14|nr:restriction endonuclease [Candidatus Termiticorpusculum sp.]MCL2257639.1 restriction endonuclease [Candidatus Termiticorpusculum sp.]MCL2292225.1 restriction endonuclease [Candidatus Termiticorpusculum sp.]MDR0460388.1 restriction endonuclease [Nitrososphaerota archaeon]
MRSIKFNGILQEIFENPNNNTRDTVELLQSRLRLPQDKAEILASRIEKHYLQTMLMSVNDNTKQPPLRIVTEKPSDTKQPQQHLQRRANSYVFESLSNKEFEIFTKWVLQELGYNVFPDKISTFLGVDYLATKEGLNVVILARKYPISYLVSKAAVFMAQQAKCNYQCEHAIILTTTVFSDKAKLYAENCGVELWDVQKFEEKILEVKNSTEFVDPFVFPTFKGTLLDSLLMLGEHKKFLIEKRVGEKYDVFFPGVNFPLLTFQVQNAQVVRLVYRIKYNESVGENDGEALINCDRNGTISHGPNDVDAYAQVLEYLEQFLE